MAASDLSEKKLSEQEQQQHRTPGLINGTLGDAFFETLPEEELQQWE